MHSKNEVGCGKKIVKNVWKSYKYNKDRKSTVYTSCSNACTCAKIFLLTMMCLEEDNNYPARFVHPISEGILFSTETAPMTMKKVFLWLTRERWPPVSVGQILQ